MQYNSDIICFKRIISPKNALHLDALHLQFNNCA